MSDLRPETPPVGYCYGTDWCVCKKHRDARAAGRPAQPTAAPKAQPRPLVNGGDRG